VYFCSCFIIPNKSINCKNISQTKGLQWVEGTRIDILIAIANSNVGDTSQNILISAEFYVPSPCIQTKCFLSELNENY